MPQISTVPQIQSAACAFIETPRPWTAAIARVLETAATLGAETSRCDIDGYRLEYAEGWISVRQSNTEPYLRLLAECDTRARLATWMSALSRAIEA